MQAIKQTTFTLELNEKEAKILAGMLQNSICDPADEPKDEGELRVEIFNFLTGRHPTVYRSSPADS